MNNNNNNNVLPQPFLTASVPSPKNIHIITNNNSASINVKPIMNPTIIGCDRPLNTTRPPKNVKSIIINIDHIAVKEALLYPLLFALEFAAAAAIAQII